MSLETIEYKLEMGIATLELNRPDVYNSFNQEMAFTMQRYLDDMEDNPEVRVIVLTGKGKAFSAGQDLNEVMDPKGPELSRIVKDHFNPIIRKIREIEKPIVAAVNGVAAGAGANIALACDFVIAAHSASFIQAFSKIGLIPDSGGTYFLPRMVGFQRATSLMMLGETLSAIEAKKIGLIYDAVEDEKFLETIQSFGMRLAKMPTRALGLTKRALNDSLNNDLSIQLRIEEILQTEASQTLDFTEGVKAFLEKRDAQFKGK